MCTDADVKGYPTLILYLGGEEVAKYSGDRTLADLKAFVASHRRPPP